MEPPRKQITRKQETQHTSPLKDQEGRARGIQHVDPAGHTPEWRLKHCPSPQAHLLQSSPHFVILPPLLLGHCLAPIVFLCGFEMFSSNALWDFEEIATEYLIRAITKYSCSG